MASANKETKDRSAQWEKDKAEKAQSLTAAASASTKQEKSSDEDEDDKDKDKDNDNDKKAFMNSFMKSWKTSKKNQESSEE
jgi:hypothetical protein